MATNDFETKFGILADATLSEKLPAAKQDGMGFQVIATEGDNNERAAGVNAYRVGKRLVYVPVFWLNGRVKGGDTMYVKDRDAFIPFGEVWMNLIETGKDIVSAVAGGPRRDGTPYRISTLDLNRLHAKRAGEVTVLPFEGLDGMMHYHDGPQVTLADHLPVFGPKAAADLAAAMVDNPRFANAVFSHYTPGEIEKVLLDCMGPLKKASSPVLEIITDRGDPRAKALTPEGKLDLVRKGVAVIDNRKEAAVAMVAKEDDVARWVTPTCNGWHNVLMDDFSVKKAYVLKGIMDDRWSTGTDGILVKEGDAGHRLFNTAFILVEDGKCLDEEPPGSPVTEEALQELLPRLPSDRGYPADDHMKHILFDGSSSLSLSPERSPDNSAIDLRLQGKNRRAVLTGKPGTITMKGGYVYIPSTARVVSAKRGTYAWSSPDMGGAQALDKAVTLAGYTPVKVASDGYGYLIEGGKAPSARMGYPKALATLVREHGLRAKQAADILEASAEPKGRASHGVTFYVATAADYEPQGDDVSLTKEAISASRLDDKAVASIVKASQSGTKEVLDTAILTSLTKSAYPLERVKEHIPALMKAIDRLGRTLFMFYWHNDVFEARYGRQNMDSIEDSLKDNIRNLGDLVIYLQEHSATADETVAKDRDPEDLSDDMV